mmetsp:Transcript_15255/g.32606  ORF Transcript_15255/g.32606 Transcript_15255/m.32606 type:complete len:93 (+) Transcript_15255:2-280(+)
MDVSRSQDRREETNHNPPHRMLVSWTVQDFINLDFDRSSVQFVESLMDLSSVFRSLPCLANSQRFCATSSSTVPDSKRVSGTKVARTLRQEE